MSKYDITVTEFNTSGPIKTAKGVIKNVETQTEKEFDVTEFAYASKLIWKTIEDGMIGKPLAQSRYTQGERMALARFLPQVALDPSLVNTSSRNAPKKTTGSRSSGESAQAATALNGRLDTMETNVAGLNLRLEQICNHLGVDIEITDEDEEDESADEFSVDESDVGSVSDVLGSQEDVDQDEDEDVDQDEDEDEDVDQDEDLLD